MIDSIVFDEILRELVNKVLKGSECKQTIGSAKNGLIESKEDMQIPLPWQQRVKYFV